MANNLWPRGISPEGITDQTQVGKWTKGTGELFIGSAYDVSAGLAVPTSSSDGTCVGAVYALLDENGSPVCSLASAAAGTVLGTVGRDQKFRAIVSTSAFAGDADIGKMYNLTAETATVQSATTYGSNYSKRMLDGTTEAASGKTFVITGLTGKQDNVAGAAYTEVFCKINHALFTDVAAS